jgi:adenosylcobinamide amidohydrolase
MAASTVSGGGIGIRDWWLNAMVPVAYHEDPAAHVHEIAAGLGLRPVPTGPPRGSACSPRDVTGYTEADDGGVRVVATVGVSLPVWAAACPMRSRWKPAVLRRRSRLSRPGTINLLVVVPVPLTDAALVNAVVTATEAKTR